MQITAFEKNNLKELRKDIETALKAVAEKHDINISTGSIRFTASSATIKLEAVVKGETGVAINPHADALKRFGKMYLGQEFEMDKVYSTQQLGDIYFVGLNRRAHKKPFIIKQISTGKEFVISDTHAARITGKTML